MKLIIYIFIGLLFAASCNKVDTSAYTSSSIEFSVDSLHFDTLISGVTSHVRTVKIFNKSNEDIQFDKIQLMNGNSSPFTINLNGRVGNEFSSVQISANDSIYLFVNIAPLNNDEDDIYILNDDVSFEWKGNQKSLALQAFIQPVIELNDYQFNQDTTLITNKKYFIRGNVEVASQVRLTIPAGVKFYTYPESKLTIKGRLEIEGTKENPVVFTTYRMDQPVSGSWEGIEIITTGKSHTIRNAKIEYAKNALKIEGTPTVLENILLDGVEINNSSGIGLYLKHAFVSSQNCLITNNNLNIYIINGGNYEFKHLTTASYSSMHLLNVNPSLYITDEDDSDNVITASFTNSIIWGDKSDELFYNVKNTSSQLIFENSIYRYNNNDINFVSINSFNEDPEFVEIDISKKIYNFRLKPISPAINFGKDIGIDIDLIGTLRADNQPDLGCYEYIQE